MQLFGTRFVVTLGTYQLRMGLSLEHEPADGGTCNAAEPPAFIVRSDVHRNGTRVEAPR